MVEQKLNEVFHALSDPTRRAMLRQLAEQEQTVSELAAPFDMSLAAASKHIKALERAGLLQRTVQGRTHICRLNARTLAGAREWFRFYEQFWTERFDMLERELRQAAMQTESQGGHTDDA